MDKLRATTTGERVTVVAAIVLLVAAFKPWLRIEVVGADGRPFSQYTRDGLQAPGGALSMLAVLIGLALTTLIVARAAGAIEVPEGLQEIGWGLLHLLGGALALGLVTVRWIRNTEHTAETGLYLGLLGAAGLAVGGFLTAAAVSGLLAWWSARRSGRRAARRSARQARRGAERVRRDAVPAGPARPGIAAPRPGGPAGWAPDTTTPAPAGAHGARDAGTGTANGSVPAPGDADDPDRGVPDDRAPRVPEGHGPRWV